MAISKEDLQYIEQHLEKRIKENLGAWLADASLARPPQVYELELRERMIRVEEELKNQRDLIMRVIEQMDKRFEQVDKRFDLMKEDMNRRFEQVDKRLDLMKEDMDRRFEQVDRRFEQVDRRFEQIDRRFEELTMRIDHFMKWSFGVTLTVGGIVIAAIKLLP